MARLRVRAGAVTGTVAAAVAAMAFAVIGCGEAPETTLESAQAKIVELEGKGVPPGELSMAKVHLAQARENLRQRHNSKARQNIASLRTVLANAETFYTEQVATLGPKIEELKRTANAARNEISGYQLRKVDSTIAVIDSFVRVDRPLQAHDAALALVALVPALKTDEATAARLRREVAGTWVFLDTVQSVEFPRRDAAITRKEFTFGRDGRVTLVESKRGQATPMFKEDWLFRSWGTFDLKGDTIMLSIDRFKAERQNFETFDPNTERWNRQVQPTYDSTIIDGSQDRFVVYRDLQTDFRRRR